jgi:hypothetical protein
MPRIIVTTDPTASSADTSVWLDEHVHAVHLSTEHAAAQFVERLAWAIGDAEAAKDAHGEHADQRGRRNRQPRGHGSARRSPSQFRVRA